MNKDFNEFKNFIKDKKVAVLGIGVSNIPLVDFLLSLGANVTAFDKNSKEYLGKVIDDFEEKGVESILGENYLDNLSGYDVIFKSPSMRPDMSALVKAKKEGAYITSEIEEFMRYCKGKIIAITGSDGKTTTTSIISRLLIEDGYNTWVGGNIGTPLFTMIENVSEEDMVVLELSSFQLMTINIPVNVAVITNITPNHLDMHKDMDEYIWAKKNIFTSQKKDAVLILNNENKITKSFASEGPKNTLLFSSKGEAVDGYIKDNNLFIDGIKVCNMDDIIIKGVHNAENFLAAFLATKQYVSIKTMKKVAETFQGVEHRCEFVREVNGVKYYNDSIASTPTRTLSGLKAFNRKVTLIAGGYNKHVPFEPLAVEGHKYIENIILLGDTKELIKEVFEKAKENINIETSLYTVDSLDDAVSLASKITNPGDIVTLSPACASFDMFRNFMLRGDKFKELVQQL